MFFVLCSGELQYSDYHNQVMPFKQCLSIVATVKQCLTEYKCHNESDADQATVQNDPCLKCIVISPKMGLFS